VRLPCRAHGPTHRISHLHLAGVGKEALVDYARTCVLAPVRALGACHRPLSLCVCASAYDVAVGGPEGFQLGADALFGACLREPLPRVLSLQILLQIGRKLIERLRTLCGPAWPRRQDARRQMHAYTRKVRGHSDPIPLHWIDPLARSSIQTQAFIHKHMHVRASCDAPA
jgi:hypothetical protein